MAVPLPPAHSKSTLLDLLAGRKTAGRLAEGSSILFNGRRPTAALLRRDGAGQRKGWPVSAVP